MRETYLRTEGMLHSLSDREIYYPEGWKEALKTRDAQFHLNQARKIYQHQDGRSSMMHMWWNLGTYWDIRAGITDEKERYYFPLELNMHGREWVHIPDKIDTQPLSLTDYFPHIDSSILGPENLIDDPFEGGYSYRVLAGGYPQVPLVSGNPQRPRNATLGLYIIANESRLALTGHPVDPQGQTVSLLTGSRNKEGDNIFARYRIDGGLDILTRDEVQENGYPVVVQHVRIDQYHDWPNQDAHDVYTPPSPLLST